MSPTKQIVRMQPGSAEAMKVGDNFQDLIGKALVRRKGGRQETRWVRDRTLGNAVCWVDRRGLSHETPWIEFREWVRDAKIKEKEGNRQ